MNRTSLIKNLVLCILALDLGGAALSAQATPVLSSGTLNKATFDTVQNIVDRGPAGLSSGDLVYGLLNVTSISASGGVVWDANNVPGPGIDSLSGYYLAQVLSVTPLPSPYAAVLTLGAATSDPNGLFSAADLAAGTVVKLFTDNATPYQLTGMVAADLVKATDGALWASLGLGGGYWDAVLMADGLVFGSEGLNLLENATGYAFDPVANPKRPTKAPTELYIATSAEPLGIAGGWQYTGTNTAYFQPNAVPEPHVALLFAFGLFGMLMSRRFAN